MQKLIEYAIDDLNPADYNPRQLTIEQHKQLSDSISAFGFVEPVVVNINTDRLNVIVSGHQRVKCAKDMGIKKVPCVELDLTLEQERELNIRMNKNTGEWDWDMLANGFDIDELLDWGFTEDELKLSIDDDEKASPPVDELKKITFEFTEEEFVRLESVLAKVKENELDEFSTDSNALFWLVNVYEKAMAKAGIPFG